ncbi:MAG: HDIG domain-containing protein [Gemmatimonadales bacterium]|nr:HDIG domain-containing protein [Gemmatimonadales bacterium]
MSDSRWTPDRAAVLMESWTASPALRAHMWAVSHSMRHMAPRHDADPDYWAVVGLLHDFDYERFPNPDRAPDAEHPTAGVAELRAQDFPEDGCEAILGHASYTGVPRTTDLARVLFAVDELAGFVVACALVRPSRSLGDLEAPSVLKKLKDKGFARGVSRDDVRSGAEELGVPLDALVRDVIMALRPHEAQLGLGAEG